MKFTRQKQNNIDIEDYYSVKVRSIWLGLKSESAAFWWLCIYVLFEYVRPLYLFPVLEVIPWAQIILLLAVVTTYLDKSVEWVRSPVNSLFIAFFIIVFLSSLFAFSPAASWVRITTVINWILIYFLIINVVNSEKRYFVFIMLFLLASFKLSQFGFRAFAGRGFSYAGWGVSGPPGWFQNSGEFGIQMVIFTSLSAAFVLALKEYWGRYKRLFFYLMPITGFFSVIATSSRGDLLGIVGVCIWFIIKSRKGLKALIGLLFIGWALYMVMPPEFKGEFQSAGEDSTSIERLELWQYGMDIMLKHPVLGIGYDNWRAYCWFENPNGMGIKHRCHEAHNTFVEAVSELGVPAFLILILMIFFMFIQNSRSRAYAKQNNNKFILYISHGLDGGVVGYVISAIFISTLFYPFIWFQLAMTVALHEVSKKLAVNNTS